MPIAVTAAQNGGRLMPTLGRPKNQMYIWTRSGVFLKNSTWAAPSRGRTRTGTTRSRPTSVPSARASPRDRRASSNVTHRPERRSGRLSRTLLIARSPRPLPHGEGGVRGAPCLLRGRRARRGQLQRVAVVAQPLLRVLLPAPAP